MSEAMGDRLLPGPGSGRNPKEQGVKARYRIGNKLHTGGNRRGYADSLSGALAEITKSPALSAGILADAAKLIARTGCRALDTHRVGIWTADEEAKFLRSVVCYDIATGEFAVQERFDLSGRSRYVSHIKSERLLVVDDIRRPGPLSGLAEEYGPALCSLLDVPVRIGGKLAGVVCIEQDRCAKYPDFREWTVAEQNFASSLADLTALAIASAERLDLMRLMESAVSNLPGIGLWDMDIVDGNDPAGGDNRFRWSPELCRVLGFSEEAGFPDALSSWSDHIHPGDKASVLEAFAAHLTDRSGKTPYNAEYRLLTKAGEYRYFRALGNTLRDADGVPLRIAGTLEDITGKINQQGTLKSVLNGMEALISVCSLEDGGLLFLNDSIRKRFGIEGDGIGQKCHKLLQGLDEPCESCPYERLRAEPDGIVEWDHTDATSGRVFHKTARLIEWPGQGKAHLEYAIDVTALMNAEKALERREKMLGALNRSAITLLSKSGKGFERMMTEGIGFIAGVTGIHRMSVYRNTRKPDGLYASQIFRWRKEIGAALPLLDELQDKPYSQLIPRWEGVLASGECINGPVRIMPEAGFLKLFDCMTLLVIPVMDQGFFWGFVVYENVLQEMEYGSDEVEMLRSASLMLSNAVIRNEEAEKLRAADEYTKLMIEGTPLSCVVFDSKRRAISCNETAVKLYKFRSKEDCIERFYNSFPEFQPGGNRSDGYIAALIDKALREGYCSFEWTHTATDGTAIPVEVTLNRVKYGDDYLIMGYARDLREHKRMMNEIDRKTRLLQTINQVASAFLVSTSESFDRDLLGSMGIMAEAVNADRVYLWKNYRKDGKLCCYQVCEWSEGAEPQQGKGFAAETFYADSVPEWEQALSKGDCVNGIVRNLSANERAMLTPQNVLSVLAVPIFLAGEWWGFIGFDDCHRERLFSRSERDILRSASGLIAETLVRHEMEESLRSSSIELHNALAAAEAASVAKSDFLSSMSHEMRTPLNAVIGMTAIGRRAGDDKRKDYALGKIEEASSHLLGVVNDILDMSKIEAGKLDLSPVEFNFEHMLQNVITVISYRIGEKRQQLSVNVGGDIPRFVIGDDQRFAQVITNLLSNATKFTPEYGEIRLGVSLLGVEDGINEIRVEVADNGIGISAEKQARLFRAFEQAESGVSREFGGTGLGLAISKQLVEMMGGKIWVESEPGKGARFIFTAKVPGGAKNLRSLLKPGVRWESVRVLAVDGTETQRRYFRETFDRLGVRCEIAANGPTARKLIERHGAFDVYLIDLYAPDTDAAELTAYIKTRGERGAVVLISSGEWESLQEAMRSCGADKGLVKPILSSALVDCMNECIGNSGEAGENDNAEEFKGKTLLLAEDIEINREIVVSLLDGTGLEIDCAENGAAALAVMEAEPCKYDVIFMDMQMPVMDGLEAARRIRALPAAWCGEIPIIAMTANVFKEDIEKCLAAGMNGHIGKPIDIDDMMKSLRLFLNTSSKPRREISPELALFRGNDGQTGRLKEGTKVSVDIRVHDGDGNRTVLSLPSVVEEVYPDGFFLIRPPLFQGDIYPLPRDEMFLIYFMAEKKKEQKSEMFVIPARFVERIERASSVYAKLEPLGNIEPSQRRNCYRLSLSASVSLKQSGGTEVDAKMVNFSDGGMLIASREALNEGDTITLDFSIGAHETVRGVILRTERGENETFPYRAAVEFVGAGREQKERFYQFIKEKQMERAEDGRAALVIPLRGTNGKEGTHEKA